ncbi:hypothetical protein [Calycomorphotria hydatis]|uniref:Uncharacterized protein n=1 Tax=Calycomorphotria hydatis TaxID=2528027 RepID=A0A517T3R1_9PLAN|nr:hypothetical protein [Calycomorphotria hydatis]QDT63012.1 hypothetical protein V22_02110 [Calycomorphotria hydatis]
MNTAEGWRNLFEGWPGSIPQQGLVVTTFGEQIPFVKFLVSGSLLIVERDKPDTQGSRKVMIAYSAIEAVKIADPGEIARYQVMGFQPPM